MSKVRWQIEMWYARWRTYNLQAWIDSKNAFCAVVCGSHAFLTDSGYPTPEAAMAAAELMARNHFAARQKPKKRKLRK